jgi:ribonuclease H-related protein
MGMDKPKKQKFYAVRAGRQLGVFHSWEECKKAIIGFSGAVYKSFESEIAAQKWLSGESLAQPPLGQKDQSDAKAFLADYDVYTDGSFVNGQYAWAYAFVKDDEVIFEDSNVGKNPAAAVMRNVAGEIAAVLFAVKRAAQMGVKIRIHHDYAGIAFWVTGEWKSKNEFTQFYTKLMNEHRGIYTFEKVKAHTGNKFNEYVDKKAKLALGLSE